jgi:hypothetical protein
MAARGIVIKTERPPSRCEVCHQSDLFDRASGKCQRCDFITIKPEAVSRPRFLLALAGLLVTLTVAISLLYFSIYPAAFIEIAPASLVNWFAPGIDRNSTSGQIIYDLVLKQTVRKYLTLIFIWILVVAILQFNFLLYRYLDLEKK